MNSFWLIFWSISYLLVLFFVANWAEQRSAKGRSLVSNSYVYALSLAVYCTAWTFYGSVGRAAESGVDFIAVFIGPTITMPLWWVIFRKIIRICQVQRITNIADFVSARYGKSQALGVIATILCVVGTIPYISIQLKAISSGFGILTTANDAGNSLWLDKAFYISIVLTIFTILFGARKLDANERHEGMVAAIAFESLFKLFAFLAVGVFVTFIVFDGFDDIVQKASKLVDLQRIFTIKEEKTSDWFWYCLLASLAIMFLPRQFQVTVVENVNENHLRKALWIFPLYLLVINIFVVPIALGGKILLGTAVKADQFVLSIPLHFNEKALAFVAYLGGFAASTSMIIVECTALTVMLTNNLVMPWLVSRTDFQRRFGGDMGQVVITLRRLFIVLLMAGSYLYYKNVSDKYSLVSVGMVSFAAVAQFAPVVLGGIFWKRGSLAGAVGGLLVGGGVWFYTLIIPSMVSAGYMSSDMLSKGPWGMDLLRPESLLGVTGLDNISHGTFWSLLLNLLFYVGGSLLSQPTALEHNQAVLFVDVFKYSKTYESAVAWKGKALVTDIKSLLTIFFGKSHTEETLQLYAKQNKLDLNTRYADSQVVNYAEKMLGGAIGAASARILVSSVAKEEQISVEEVIDILKTSQELKTVNEELTRKSEELEQLTQQLKQANELLQIADIQKDDFLSTVTHEIRTPLTSIRALSEIVHDNPDMEEDQRSHFVNTITKESERLTRLINQVLALERFETGKQELDIDEFLMEDIVEESLEALDQLAKEKNIKIDVAYEGIYGPIRADRDRLIQVIINLVSNAIKFCPADTGKIQINTLQTEASLSFSISDNGQGIDNKYQELIFEKFYQTRDQSVRKPKGSGLGLAICKKIIELHQGTIKVESELGKGSVFTCEIPLGKN
ncbi:signal transduction histidine kinase/Na+/proline symporter [Runella defluvii]|uniref:histidine kinase n=1 Tax=Runella defluvii TaxID=370973 RepID=A0A7W6ER60_9BACT|nr:sensor histidine kinase [Runella defluvii]MBB3839188.1 signal transduction histidine kinase/Na+/proline symporter [Runella defluvii]